MVSLKKVKYFNLSIKHENKNRGQMVREDRPEKTPPKVYAVMLISQKKHPTAILLYTKALYSRVNIIFFPDSAGLG